jgi:hypothetical protein
MFQNAGGAQAIHATLAFFAARPEKYCAIPQNVVYFSGWVHPPHPFRCASGTPHETRGNAK